MHGRLIISALTALALTAGSAVAEAQTEEKGRDGYKGLTFKLSDSEFIRFITWHQVWLRFTELNPGSQVNGVNKDGLFDIALRRSRFLAFAELNEFQIMTHFGINNQTFNNARKPQLFMHDAWVQYHVIKSILSIGFGLHYWHGISRLTNQSTLNLATLDGPITNWPTIERTDQFARFLGIWAKGKLGGFEYRVALNKPFQSDRTPGIDIADYNGQANTLSYAGYFEYQFFDTESNTLPYKVGTYIGGKKVFNIGAGFYFHPDAMASLEPGTGDRRTHDQLLFGIDAYLDMPLGDKDASGAISAYLVFYQYDFGPNHIRSIGISNVATGGSSFNGPGNAYPSIGTGQHVYGQAAYLLPPNLFGGWEFMPYVALQVSNFDALDDPMVLFEGGLNWFLQGHHAKVTFAFRNRPVFVGSIGSSESPGLEGGVTADTRANEAIVQMMVFL